MLDPGVPFDFTAFTVEAYINVDNVDAARPIASHYGGGWYLRVGQTTGQLQLVPRSALLLTHFLRIPSTTGVT